MKPDIVSFFDEATKSVSYIVADPESKACAVIDVVLDFDAKAARTASDSADAVIARLRESGYRLEWILETHVHADHLSAAPHIQAALGGRTGIGENVAKVQQTFARVFNAEAAFATDGSQFDVLFKDGARFAIGGLEVEVLHTPGHTPACITYVVGDAAFIGDTLFMPDYGTARCDFPNGDSRQLYRSMQRILALPEETRLFHCHDYAPGGRDYAWESTVRQQKRENIHLCDGKDEAAFAAFRDARDATLDMPALILPAVQVNMRAGALPPPEDNGTSYLKLPLNTL
ncbi:MAG: MBL fold metallo-hydrolase [Rhodovibrionaceae bacterium]